MWAGDEVPEDDAYGSESVRGFCLPALPSALNCYGCTGG